MTKLCPLRPIPTESGRGYTNFATCIGEECAWFDESECAIKGLSSIAGSLYEMRKNY